jgi:hypothetical protein
VYSIYNIYNIYISPKKAEAGGRTDIQLTQDQGCKLGIQGMATRQSTRPWRRQYTLPEALPNSQNTSVFIASQSLAGERTVVSVSAETTVDCVTVTITVDVAKMEIYGSDEQACL